jgi:hypothetical protein
VHKRTFEEFYLWRKVEEGRGIDFERRQVE